MVLFIDKEVHRSEGDKEQENEKEKEDPLHYYDDKDDLYNIEEQKE